MRTISRRQSTGPGKPVIAVSLEDLGWGRRGVEKVVSDKRANWVECKLAAKL